MKYNFGDCRKKDKEKNKTVVLFDEDSKGKYKSKSKFRIINNKLITIYIVKIDHCLEFQGQKCDWLFIVEKNNTAYFIELKSKKRDDGVKQLANSVFQVKNLQNEYITEKFDSILSYLVLHNVPRNDTKTANLKKSFKKQYNSELRFVEPKNAVIEVS
ncbi:MAG: hypothetical protein B6D62_00285 [Candidatus Cloacimonas sp. 4484_275]|nr:MAG: hypothetical protein B6D62_00285 [Candidatus Cloacimonas sp. 4484_275]